MKQLNPKALLACLCLIAVHPFIMGGCGGSDSPSSPRPLPIADLYDNGWEFHGWHLTGEDLSIWCDVRNGGTADAGGFYIDYYASTNTTITTSDYLLGWKYVSGCAAGNYVEVTTIVSLPVLPAGKYYIGWIIDALYEVDESNEFNNKVCISTYMLDVSAPAGPVAFVPLNTDAGDSPASRRMTKQYRQP